jgi:hypothetical protein
VNSFLKRITKYPVVFPAYNDNDDFMTGAGFTNVFKTDSAAMRYLIAPTYSFSQKKILGTASLQYIKYVNQASISSYVGGLTLRSFDIQRNVELDYALRYFLIRPFVGIVFKHSGRPEHESRLTFRSSVPDIGYLQNPI